jgi:hypothetical protein
MVLYLPSILAEVAGPNLAKARSTSSLTYKANNEWQLIRKTIRWVYDKVHYRLLHVFKLTTLRRIGSRDEQSFCKLSILRASTITLKKIQVASKPSERFMKARYNKLQMS